MHSTYQRFGIVAAMGDLIKCGQLSIGMTIAGPESDDPGDLQVCIMMGEDEGDETHIVAMDVHAAMAFAMSFGRLVNDAHETFHDIEDMTYEQRVQFMEDKVAQSHGDLN